MTAAATTKERAKQDPTQALKQYMSLVYPMEVIEAEDGVTITIPDLPGCMAYGETYEEAKKSLDATKKLWIQGQLDAGNPIPEPTEVEQYSGKFVLRIARSLHRKLDHEAKAQGVSLNQYISTLLSERHAVQTISHQLVNMMSESVVSHLCKVRWQLPNVVSAYSFSGELPGDFGMLPHVCTPLNQIDVLYRHQTLRPKAHAEK